MDAKTGDDVAALGVSLGTVLAGSLDKRRATAACAWSRALACKAACALPSKLFDAGVLVLEDSARFEHTDKKFVVPFGYVVSIGHTARVMERGYQQVKVEGTCLLYTSPSPRDQRGSRMPSSA